MVPHFKERLLSNHSEVKCKHIISNLVQVRKHQLYRRGPRLLIRHKHSTSDPKKISTTNVLNKKHGDFTKTKFLE